MNLNTNHKTYVEEPEEYTDYGQIDIEDHEIAAKIERDERLNKELNPNIEI